MTRIFGLVDPDPERRRTVLAGVARRFDGQEGLRTIRWQQDQLVVLASVGETVPVDQANDPTGSAWVLGTVYGDDGEAPATHVLGQLRQRGGAGINGLNGYYLACTVEPSGAVSLGTDVLGFFPLYFWANREVLVFATDPGLVRLHPGCPGKLSLEGLAGILLQGHEANGQSIWKGVTRPDPGHILCWAPGSGRTIRGANSLSPGEQYFDFDYEAARQLIAGTLEESVARALTSQPRMSLMLSGGIDSRLVAGYMARLRRADATAFTFGDPGDIEANCAARVARELGLRAVRLPMRFDGFANLAAECIGREQLSNTLWDFTWLSGLAELSRHRAPMLNGFHGDAIMGGSPIPWALDARSGLYSFETLFAKAGAFGFPPDEIAHLVSDPSMDHIVRDVVDGMRVRYEALPGLPFQKGWLWGLQTRDRYHAAAYAWRLSDAAWPLMPYSDRRLLEVTMHMPLNFVWGRRMQIDTLKMDFPALARLPLDRNSFDARPLNPSIYYRIRERLLGPFSDLFNLDRERRAYYRAFDINNAGWRTVRNLAELSRNQAHALFRPEELARWIPAADVAIGSADAIRDTANRKTLLALMIFAGQEADARFDN